MSAETSGKVSLALSKKTSRPNPTIGVKRSHATLRDADDEEHDEGIVQTVSHFDNSAGGAIDQANPKPQDTPLIIAPQANRDWKEASQRKRRRRDPSEDAHRDDRITEQPIKDSDSQRPQFGLNITPVTDSREEAVLNGDRVNSSPQVAEPRPPGSHGEGSVSHKTDDEIAIDALLGRTSKSDLVLPAMTEAEAFERDFQSAPDMATLDDYARVPVEQFGAALLRGMGWKDGEGIGVNKGKKVEKSKLPDRRPALLGIGAKEDAAVAQELGAWGKAARRGEEIKIYNPVLLRDKKTGKLYTEEELQKKREQDVRRQYEEEFDRKERKKDRGQRHGDGGRVRDKDRDRNDRIERREERRDHRDRRRRDDSDEEYYRTKEKDRRRRERDREDSDYTRDRRTSHDSHRSKHRDHHGDRMR
ncbi:hypothetical protein M433DRAFT_389753 [Acidomyces richmondensis BFW]|nr:MAG: hypothetical protein FE78DRAFT_66093 [Acidomyces sp. 'richmondensis']KYG50423.1 hypothetical protein M433DRAFT_389753 [Acidomyces richmondensis BFW]